MAKHVCNPAVHSFTSAHDMPVPVNPALHAQVKLLTVSVHVAFSCAHIFACHAFTSPSQAASNPEPYKRHSMRIAPHAMLAHMAIVAISITFIDAVAGRHSIATVSRVAVAFVTSVCVETRGQLLPSTVAKHGSQFPSEPWQPSNSPSRQTAAATQSKCDARSCTTCRPRTWQRSGSSPHSSMFAHPLNPSVVVPGAHVHV